MCISTRSKNIKAISFVVVWLDWLDSRFLIDKLHEIHFKQENDPLWSVQAMVSTVIHFQTLFNKVFGLEAITCLLTSSPWLIEGQLDSSAHSVLCSLLWCMRDMHALTSLSVVAAPIRGTEPVFCCWSGKYKQWSIVSVSDQLALCLWILRPAEIVCSTPQDVL